MKPILIAALGLIAVSANTQATDHVVDQKNKEFTVSHLEIKVGDEVRFDNSDPFFHNVFSLSETTTFDLGSYPGGESKSMIFNEPGKIDVECAIHPNMHMIVEVK